MKASILFIAAAMIGSASKAQNTNEQKGVVIKKGFSIYSEITIQSSPENIWKILMNFEEYKNWNPFIIDISGDAQVGNTIEAHIKPTDKSPMTFKPKVLVREENREFRWIGKFLMPRIFDGEHVFQIIDNNDGSCTFIQYEKFRGALVPFMKKMLNVNSLDGFKKMNQALKERAEQK
jgi:hypothetical protein